MWLLTTYEPYIFVHCIVLYFRLFSNMGDKTHPFAIGLYDTFMQKVRVETSNRNKSRANKKYGRPTSKGYGER